MQYKFKNKREIMICLFMSQHNIAVTLIISALSYKILKNIFQRVTEVYGGFSLCTKICLQGERIMDTVLSSCVNVSVEMIIQIRESG